MSISKVENGFIVTTLGKDFRQDKSYVFLNWDDIVEFIKNFKFEEKNNQE